MCRRQVIIQVIRVSYMAGTLANHAAQVVLPFKSVAAEMWSRKSRFSYQINTFKSLSDTQILHNKFVILTDRKYLICSWGLASQPPPSNYRLVYIWHKACTHTQYKPHFCCFKSHRVQCGKRVHVLVLCLHIIYTSGPSWHIWGFAFCLAACRRGETLFWLAG